MLLSVFHFHWLLLLLKWLVWCDGTHFSTIRHHSLVLRTRRDSLVHRLSCTRAWERGYWKGASDRNSPICRHVTCCWQMEVLLNHRYYITQRNWTSSFSTMEACTWSERLGAWLMLRCLRSSCSIARNNSNVLWLIQMSPPRLLSNPATHWTLCHHHRANLISKVEGPPLGGVLILSVSFSMLLVHTLQHSKLRLSPSMSEQNVL